MSYRRKKSRLLNRPVIKISRKIFIKSVIFPYKTRNRRTLAETEFQVVRRKFELAPLVGLEPTTYRLTAERSTN